MAQTAEPDIDDLHRADLVAVHAFLEALIASARFATLLTVVLGLFARLRQINADLGRQLARFQGRRHRSERLRAIEQQLAFAFLEPLPTRPAAHPDDALEPDTTKRKQKKKRSRSGRIEFPQHLPRRDVPNDVPAEQRVCKDCGCQMHTMARHACETLEFEPGHFYVKRRMDEVVACRRCDNIKEAPAPSALIPRGVLGLGLVSEAVCDKFLLHQPIERQARNMRRQGVPVSPCTLGGHVDAALDLLAPVSRRIHARALASHPLSMDASGIPVLDRNAPSGIRTGTLWCFVGAARWISFVYAPVGDGQSVIACLGERAKGVVQCDGSSVLNVVEREGGCRPGCWSHARRGLAEALAAHDLQARTPLLLIAELFTIERDASSAGDSVPQRTARRQQHAVPVLERLRHWVLQNADRFAPKSSMGRACTYLKRQWLRLCLFTLDGAIPLTNNHVERSIRVKVLGRHNWLFTGSDDGARRTATAYALLETAAAHGLDPRRYLRVVLDAIVAGWKQADLDQLLPDAITTKHPDLRVPALDGVDPSASRPAAAR